jgi:hypothetical protein
MEHFDPENGRISVVVGASQKATEESNRKGEY